MLLLRAVRRRGRAANGRFPEGFRCGSLRDDGHGRERPALTNLGTTKPRGPGAGLWGKRPIVAGVGVPEVWRQAAMRHEAWTPRSSARSGPRPAAMLDAVGAGGPAGRGGGTVGHGSEPRIRSRSGRSMAMAQSSCSGPPRRGAGRRVVGRSPRRKVSMIRIGPPQVGARFASASGFLICARGCAEAI